MTDLIKNTFVFNDPYVPTRLLQRHQELKLINFIFKRGTGNLLLLGPTGSGKTLLVKWALNKSTNLSSIYVPCSSNFTLKSLGLLLAQHLGFSCNPRKENTEYIFNKLTGYLKKPFFVILDDLDRVKPRQVCDILKLQDSFPSLSFVIVTNKLNFLALLKRQCLDVLHRVSPNQIFFQQYNAIEVENILMDRCREGLVPGSFSKEVINQFAATISVESEGNIRVGIKSIKMAADKATINGKQMIDMKDLDEAREKVAADNWTDISMNLNKHEQLIFLSILVNPGTFSAHLENYLGWTMAINLDPLDKSNIWRSLCRLLESGLIYPEDIGRQTHYFPVVQGENKARLAQVLWDELVKKYV